MPVICFPSPGSILSLSCDVLLLPFFTTGSLQGILRRTPRSHTCSDAGRFYYRGYSEAKLQENLDAEIFGLLLEEAREAYDEEIVVDLTSEKDDDVESNCARIVAWIEAWKNSKTKNID